MRRRQVLAGVATGLSGALAGCSDPRASLRLEPVDDAAIADRYALHADALSEEPRRIVAEAVEEGSATADSTGSPFDPPRPVRYDGAYYELDRAAVGEYEATGYEFAIDYEPGEDAGERGEVDYDDLPDVDRDALGGLLSLSRPPDDEHPEVVAQAVYADEEADRSVLVPDQEYDVVIRDGERYRLAVDGSEPVTVTEYRYTAEEVAPDDAAMAEQVREGFRFELSGLSGAQREILDAAIEGEYREEEPTEAFQGLVDRIRANEAIDADEHGGDWLARYDGDDYWVDLRTPRAWRRATAARATPSEY